MAKHGKLQTTLEYALARSLISGLGVLPRSAAVGLGRLFGRIVFHLPSSLRRTGERNLEIAFPELRADERKRFCSDPSIVWDGCSANLPSSDGPLRNHCAS